MKETIAHNLIDICICTYNRVDYLKRCLDKLVPQLASDKLVITVIDNNSSDETKAYVQALESKNNSIRYVHETQQGLSHARNTAWRTSDCEWIFYLDDDCLPLEELVKSASYLLEHHTENDAFGGPIDAIFEEKIPNWLPEGFGNFKMPYETLTSIKSGFIRGGCFMIKRNVLKALNGFDNQLGVKGSKLRYGEEIELQIRMRKEGYKIAYAPSLRTGHFVRSDKLSLPWVLHSEYARRRDKMLFEPISLISATGHLIRTSFGRFLWIPIHLGEVIFNKRHTTKKAFYQIAQPFAYSLGEWVGVFLSKRKR